MTPEQLEKWQHDMEKKMHLHSHEISSLMNRHKRLSDAVQKNNEQTQEMFDLFSVIKNGLLFFGRLYNGCVWLANKLSKLIKPLVVIVLFAFACWKLFKTGVWDFDL